MACSLLAIMVTLGILFSVLWESILFFRSVPVHEFLFGLQWSPQTAMRADQVGSSGSFGAIPLFLGTMMISGIAMLVAFGAGLLLAPPLLNGLAHLPGLAGRRWWQKGVAFLAQFVVFSDNHTDRSSDKAGAGQIDPKRLGGHIIRNHTGHPLCIHKMKQAEYGERNGEEPAAER